MIIKHNNSYDNKTSKEIVIIIATKGELII